MATAEIPEEPGMGFVTERLHVRRLVMSDLADFHEVWGNPDVIFWDAERGDEVVIEGRPAEDMMTICQIGPA